MLENKRRTKPRTPSKKKASPWGNLMEPEDEERGESAVAVMPKEEGESGSDSHEEEEPWNTPRPRFNAWSFLAALLFFAFTGSLFTLVVQMWRPQDLSDIAGYGDKGAPRDLTLALKNAGGAEISFTEEEINRYLRDTCQMRQGGIFSLLAHAQGIAVRIHDQYAEFIIDRVISTHLHQTTSVLLSFRREQFDDGRSTLRVEFRGGEPLLGSLPRGGSIGRVGLPQRQMELLRPAIKTLMDCYPEFVHLIEQYGYCPEFVAGHYGEESRMRLVPDSSAGS